MRYLIWLQESLGAGNKHAKEAVSYFGSAEALYRANAEARAKSGIFTKNELLKLENGSIGDAIRIIAECKLNGIRIIPFGSDNYPYCLSVIENPPMVIYVKGELPDFDKLPTICIVGPRKVTDFGKKAAYSLSFRLAKAGFTVVSGGALGTDTYVHAGALKAGGKTALCMGCGILSDYLPENAPLRKAIAKNGCLISEYPPKTNASKYTFPVRNRIMSALSLGTVVIEAKERSGALITARHSYEQGRDVFVIPASPDKKEYAGSNALLRDGAKPLLDASDIFNEYILRFPDKINIDKAYSKPIIEKKKTENKQKIKKNEKKLNETLSKEAKIVYNCLDKQFFIPEEIVNTGLSPEKLLSALTELEMEFLIRAIPGGRYEKLGL